ncbi:MAG: hypothetical protein ACREIJ_05420, partial [Nitrospiraceae bacterium]
SLYLSSEEWPRLPFSARIERPPLHRGGSASKKGTWPLRTHLSEAARCTSTDTNAPSELARYLFKKVAWFGPQLRTSNDHSLSWAFREHSY